MVKTIFLAPPGSGKGTQAKKLAEATGAMHISTGDALREAVEQKTPAGLRAKEYMDIGKLAPDEVVLQIVRDRLQQSSRAGWILDGFPRNEKQAIALDKIMAELDQKKYCVIYFEVLDNRLVG
jgi:adenylate kinase